MIREVADESESPPITLPASHSIARVIKAEGNNLYSVELPVAEAKTDTLLVELAARFRSTIWIKRGGFVVVDLSAFGERENKLDGEIANVVRDEKQWRKEAYWPKEFAKKSGMAENEEDDDDLIVGHMPPLENSDVETTS